MTSGTYVVADRPALRAAFSRKAGISLSEVLAACELESKASGVNLRVSDGAVMVGHSGSELGRGPENHCCSRETCSETIAGGAVMMDEIAIRSPAYFDGPGKGEGMGRGSRERQSST